MTRLAILAAFLSPALADTQEWTRFRGPNGSGVSPIVGLPTSWKNDGYEWTTKLPGRGHSSPVLWGDAIFVTSADAAHQRQIARVDAKTGAIAWVKSFPGAKFKMHARNSSATSTPTVDAQRIYTLWATPEETLVMALDHDGKVVWKIDLGPYHGNHGIGVSPILVDDLLIVPNDQDTNGSLVALEAATGTRRWSIPRQSGNASYATPCVYRAGTQSPRIIFTNWKHGITAVDPKTGKVDWEASVFDTKQSERSIVSPILAGDLIIGTSSFTTAQKHFVAVRPTADGKAQEVWRLEKSVAHLPTPIVHGDHIYIVTEKGVASCLAAKSGAVVWQERLNNEFYASPVSAAGIIYATANDGEVVVFKASPRFEILARNSLGHPCQATPALADHRLIFRTEQHLLVIKASR